MTGSAAALLEREDELAAIGRALDHSCEGEGRILLIEGEAGAGKTALLGAAARLGAERGMRVLRARGGEFERDFPYGVVRQLFEPLLGEGAPAAELIAAEAAASAPVFAPETAPAGGADPFAVQHGLFHLSAGLADEAPLLLSVDDAQWADLASLRALVYVGRRLAALPVALALTVRGGEPGEHEALLDALRCEPGVRAIVPSALTREATAELIAGEAGCEPSRGFTAACCEATAGNPFLMTELLRALGSAGIEPGDDVAGQLAELVASGVARPILARLARLGENATAVARAAAVLEPNAEAHRIAALCDLPAESVAEACERLVRACLLSDSQPVAFVHPLVREAVLSEVPAPRRAADHARAARLLGEEGAPGDAVASHLLLAEPAADRWAVGELRAAAAEALGRGAPDAAVSYLRRALREPPPKAERLEISRELGVALLRADEPEGIEVLRAVRGALGDPTARAEIALELSVSLAFRRPGEEGAALLEESLAELPDRGGELALALRGQLVMHTFSGLQRLPDDAPPRSDEAVDPGSEGGRMLLRGLGFLHALGLGSMARAVELTELAGLDPALVEADAKGGQPPSLALAALVMADRGYEGELFELMLDASRRRGTTPGVAASFGVRAYCRLAEGELDAAWDDADTAVRLVYPTGLRVGLSNWLGIALRVAVARGELGPAAEMLDRLWRGRDPIPGVPGAMLLIGRGELRRATDRHAEARHDFIAAGERLRWLPYANPEVLGWRTGLAQAEAALGNEAEARELAAESLRLACQVGGRRGIGIALRVQGAVTPGRAGVETLREAVAVLAETRARLQHAHALADLGAALRRANRRSEARGPLREALDLATRCGAVPLAERARTELAATGARPRKAVLSGVEALTPSELRVARMAAEGRTNREIAQALVVTPKTVETHLRHAFQKLGVGRRTELAAALAS